MPKVYFLDGFRDWQSGALLADQDYAGKAYFVEASGWLETWIENGERAYKGISNLCRACDGQIVTSVDGTYRYCARCGLLEEES